MTTNSNSTAITLAVHSVDQLLDVEGSPLIEPRLHPDVVRAIWESARSRRIKLRDVSFFLTFEVPVADANRTDDVRHALCSHFQSECAEATNELRDVFRRGRIGLVISLGIVALLILISEAIQLLEGGRFATLLTESLVIIGWVVLWVPTESLLFDHFPIRRRQNLARALGNAEVTLVTRP